MAEEIKAREEKEDMPFDFGVCDVENGRIVRLKKEWTGQGYVFKSWNAFEDEKHPDRPCYVPESVDDIAWAENAETETAEADPDEDIDYWTRARILELCGESPEVATQLFCNLSWQSPSAELTQMEIDGEVDTCRQCGKKFLSSHTLSCPYCEIAYRRRYFVSMKGSVVVYAKDEDEACELALDNISIDETHAYLIHEDGTVD